MTPYVGFSGGDVLVGFSPENEYDLLEWMDNSSNYPSTNGPVPPGFDWELRGSGTTPIAGSLEDALAFSADPAQGPMPSNVTHLGIRQEARVDEGRDLPDPLRLTGRRRS